MMTGMEGAGPGRYLAGGTSSTCSRLEVEERESVAKVISPFSARVVGWRWES